MMGRSGAGKSTLLGLLYARRPMDVALVSADFCPGETAVSQRPWAGSTATRPRTTSTTWCGPLPARGPRCAACSSAWVWRKKFSTKQGRCQ